MSSERLGLIKKDWKLSEVKGNPLYLTIDLGKSQELSGLAYTPQAGKNFKGGVTKVVVKVSDDGQQWKISGKCGVWEFSERPTKRFHYFKNTVAARYVRIEPTVMAQEGKLTLGNIDLL